MKKIVRFLGLIVFFVALLFVWMAIFGAFSEPMTPDQLVQYEQEQVERAERKRREQEQKRAEEEAALRVAQEQKALEKEKGHHCLSGWDGSHPQFVRELKKRLNDPGSFGHVGTWTGSNIAGSHKITMKFRASNSFGGTVQQTATGEYSNEDCRVLSLGSIR